MELKPVETGIFRLNRVREAEKNIDVLCTQHNDAEIPEGYIDYEPAPREYILSSVSSILKIGTRVTDLYSKPYDQIAEQIRLGTESIKERQEFLSPQQRRLWTAEECRAWAAHPAPQKISDS